MKSDSGGSLKAPSRRASLPNFIQNRLQAQLTAEMISSIEMETRFTANEIKRLYQQFRTIANKQNLLDEAGFRESMGVLGMVQDSILCQRLFSVFNTNQSGYITFQEYAIGLNTLIKGTVDEKLTFAFAMTDLDGSGEITPEELEITVDSIMRIYSGIMGSASTGILDRNKIRKMFNKLDKDKNGLITLQEYIRGMKANPYFVSSLRGSDLFSVGQTNLVKEEKSKIKHFVRITKLLESDIDFARQIIQRNGRTKSGASLKQQEEDESLIYNSDASTILDSDSEEEMDEPVHERNDTDTTDHQVLTEIQHILSRMKLRLSSCRDALENMPNRSGSIDVFETVHEDETSPISASTNIDSLDSDHFASKTTNEEVLNLADIEELSPRNNILEEHENGEGGESSPGLLERVLAPAAKGSTVFFGHESWDLVVNVMKGIQMAVGRSAAEASRPLNMFDFSVKEKYTLLAGSRMGKSAKINTTLADTDLAGRSCRFVDYAPLVFCKLREHFGIRNEDYVHSIGPGNMLSNLMLGSLSSLNELGSEGKSGSFFYFTSDGLFMVKTIHKEEHKLLRHILSHYYYHMTSGVETGDRVDSLLCRIVGCHVIRLSKNSKIGAEKIYFVVMTNMLHTDLDLTCRYDLKGSTVGRRCSEEARANPKATLKDLDFLDSGRKIRLGPENKAKMMKILERDAAFLESKHIIDYSLLLGISDTTASKQNSFSSFTGNFSRKSSAVSSVTSMGEEDDDETYVPFFQQHEGGILSKDEKEVYVMGVIDFLTLYTSRKRAERIGKAYILFQNKDGISVQNPQRYKERFINWMDKIIE